MKLVYLPRVAVLALALAAVACGGGGYGDGGTPPQTAGTPAAGYTITIRGMAFSPLDLAVPPGATVTVVNQDGMLHSVTSETAAGAFVPGAVGGVSFDTGAFTGQRTFAVPANAAEGTVVPYYCSTHLATMATPNGRITIRAAAQPSQTPAPEAPRPPGY